MAASGGRVLIDCVMLLRGQLFVILLSRRCEWEGVPGNTWWNLPLIFDRVYHNVSLEYILKRGVVVKVAAASGAKPASRTIIEDSLLKAMVVHGISPSHGMRATSRVVRGND